MVPRARQLIVSAVILGFLTSLSVMAEAGPPVAVTFTVLHTNDFHGQLEPFSSNPGAARDAFVINSVRAAVGPDNVLLVDAGDVMQGSLLSNIGDGTPTGKGIPTIATFNAMGYDVGTFGNHDFDWGQANLTARTLQAAYPYVSANIVMNDTGDCSTAGWTAPAFVDGGPYQVLTVGVAPNTVKVGFIGVITAEMPIITTAAATAGLCFKDPAQSVLHYYDAMKAAGADVIVVVSHLGYTDGGYGYGIPVYGDQTLAQTLISAGKPANMIIGGHSHTNMLLMTPPGAKVVGGATTVAQAHYNGRQVGRADITVSPDGTVDVSWTSLPVGVAAPKDPAIDALVTGFATDPAYLALVNAPVGYSAVDLPRGGGKEDNMMAAFIDDAIYQYLNGDAEPSNDVDIFLNNAGGIRTDWCWSGSGWVNTGCVGGVHDPGLLTYGNMFTVLPFGNATVVGEMTGAQILEVLNYGPLVGSGVIQPAGLKYKYFAYKDPDPPHTYTWAWGAFDYCVIDKATEVCEPLDLNRTYKVGTNEFLAPSGGDGYGGFKYMKNITYWGDMLNAVNAHVAAHHGTPASAYLGPNGDGTLDGRIVRDGDDDGGSIVPVTVLHHNDAHGNLVKGTYVGYTQLAAKIIEARAYNPDRTLLLNAGDSFQGDAMMYYFRTAFLGYAADGTPLADPAMHINPLLKAFNFMNYDAMTLGNHEFNFGRDIFAGLLAQADFPILQANLEDDGLYGIAAVPVEDYVLKTVGPEGIKVAILGIGNHRVPNYELPSNIPGLTFTDPIIKAQGLSDVLRPANDVVLALTHIGFTENPASVEVDNKVDTYMAQQVTGLDLIIGGHSHTNPASGFGEYKFLPTIVAGPTGAPVLINQAYRYNTTLGEVVLGMRSKAGGGYEVASRAGRYITVASGDPEDAAVKAMAQPYVDLLAAYTNTPIGQTAAPLDTTNAYVAETNTANLQADASVWELGQHFIAADFYLAGAMTRPAASQNWVMFPAATPGTPAAIEVHDMFTLMPYENSLVVLNMNGPQIKAVLERAYRNYYYYKYVPGYGGYSYYTTCMLDISQGGGITYNDLYPEAYDPGRGYVVSLVVDGQEVDFDDPDTYYRVSTVNYLAAGSCNFNDGGVSLWPLDQIAYDTQYYVRDAVINYITAMASISPQVEGRLEFIHDDDPPMITINSPVDGATYQHPDFLTLDFTAVDVGDAGLDEVWADLDGTPVDNGQVIDLLTLSLGEHTLTVYAVDKAGNTATPLAATFTVTATAESLLDTVERFLAEGKIDIWGIRSSLIHKLQRIQQAVDTGKPRIAIRLLRALINELRAQSGKHITSDAAALLIADAQWVIDHLI